MAESLFAPYGIKVPSYSTLCRGIKRLAPLLPKLSRRRPKMLLVDSSGFKLTGEGEWKVKIHGRSRRRRWVKVHLVVDPVSNEIIDLIVTASDQADINAAIELVQRAPRSLKRIVGDGAYDGSRFRQISSDLGVEVLAPPPKHAVSCDFGEQKYLKQRNEALRLLTLLGGDDLARRIWRKLSGYSQRAKVESAFARLKRLFGPSLFSRRPEAQIVEIYLKALLSNLWISWY